MKNLQHPGTYYAGKCDHRKIQILWNWCVRIDFCIWEISKNWNIGFSWILRCRNFKVTKFLKWSFEVIIFWEHEKSKTRTGTLLLLVQQNLHKLGYEFISIDKTWHVLFFFNFLHFRARESPSPLNIPIPTPASDHGGPVACICGPISGLRFWTPRVICSPRVTKKCC